LYPTDPNASNNIGLRRLHSYPSGSDTSDTTSPPQPQRPTGKPPVPERNADLLSKVSNKRVPPPPPPRTSSRSPLASPTSPHLQRMPSLCESNVEQAYNNNHQSMAGSNNNNNDQGNNSSGESVASDNSQNSRQMALELRHQELLKKQKQLQEQYQRLQQMSKNSLPMAPGESLIKKTGSESNLPMKMGLNMSIGSGSMRNLASENNNLSLETQKNEKNSETSTSTTTTTNKVYETDIL
jgi:SRC kinase signaling inhibitor 1